jgi:osmotically-inducible protein OsmY
MNIITLNGPFSIEDNCINSVRLKIPTFCDDNIKSSIITTLTWYSHTPLEEIAVTVKYGYVTLAGIVPWTYQKMVIASMVQNIEGVKGIINNIRVVNKMPRIAETIITNS